MTKVYFVQFYSDQHLTSDGKNYYDIRTLRNGFSSTYKRCKNMGDMVWVDSDKPILPNDADIAYVSGIYASDVLVTLNWAKDHPDTKVLVGGCAMSYTRRKFDILPNVTYSVKSVEDELFNGKYDEDWTLTDFPTWLKKNYLYSYATGNLCYWGKCTFCSYPRPTERLRDIDQLTVPTDYARLGIWIVNPSLTPSWIRRNLPLLPAIRGRYFGFARADDMVAETLDETLPSVIHDNGEPILRLRIGLECPSNRMLRLMNKGTTTDSLLRMCGVLAKHHCNFSFTAIYGWENLTAEDLTEVGEFCSKAYKILGTKVRLRLHPLRSNTERGNTRDVILDKIGAFKTTIKYPILSIEQTELNRQLKKIYEMYFAVELITHGGYEI